MRAVLAVTVIGVAAAAGCQDRGSRPTVSTQGGRAQPPGTGAGSPGSGTRWVEVTSDDPPFTALFPYTPKRRPVRTSPAAVMLLAESEADRAAFMLTWQPRVDTTLPIDDDLRALVENERITRMALADARVGGDPARELACEHEDDGHKWVGRYRALYSGGGLYMLGVLVHDRAFPTEDADTFFARFRLRDRK